MLLCGIERKHEVEHHFVDFLRTTVRFVHLIDYHNRFESYLKRLLEHETGLRHRSFESIDEKDASVGHVEYSLHLATEVAVSRSVNDIDLSVLVIDGNILGKDCYSTLSFQFVVVENQITSLLVLTEEIASQ